MFLLLLLLFSSTISFVVLSNFSSQKDEQTVEQNDEDIKSEEENTNQIVETINMNEKTKVSISNVSLDIPDTWKTNEGCITEGSNTIECLTLEKNGYIIKIDSFSSSLASGDALIETFEYENSILLNNEFGELYRANDINTFSSSYNREYLLRLIIENPTEINQEYSGKYTPNLINDNIAYNITYKLPENLKSNTVLSEKEEILEMDDIIQSIILN